jgi:ribosomal protein S18 acetylase RimI-like enzyme
VTTTRKPTIRRLAEEDAEAFRALRLRSLQESPEAFGSSYEEAVTVSAARMAQRFLPNQNAPHNFYLGAFDPHLVGMVGFQRESRAKTRHRGGIRSLYVAAEARGRGIGRTLLERVIAEAREQPGVEQVTLVVVSTNAVARHLYETFGFTVYGVEPRALKLGDTYYDEDLMILHF